MSFIREALEQYATTTKREWATDRSQTVGASEVGQCARKVFWLKNEGDPVCGAQRDTGHADRWGATARGSVYEKHWWEPALRARFGDALLFAGDDQKTFVSGFLSGTPDGLVIGLEEGPTVVECKTADPRTKLDEAKPEHVYQVQVQMGLIREHTNHAPDRAIISYTDTSFWDEGPEFEVAFDEAIYLTAKKRAADIMTAKSGHDLRAEGKIAGGQECAFCPFKNACAFVRVGSIPRAEEDVDLLASVEIASLARHSKALGKEIAQLEQEQAELNEQIKERLRAANTKSLVAHGVSINWSPVKGRPSYDMKGLRDAAAAAGVDLAQFETVGLPTDRLTISVGGNQ